MSDGISAGSPFRHRSWDQLKSDNEELERSVNSLYRDLQELRKMKELTVQRNNELVDARRELQNKLTLTEAERDAAVSLLLEVQQDCIELRKQLNDNKSSKKTQVN